MKRNIDVWEHTKEILTALKRGILITTRDGDFINTMAISWGHLGIQWNKPIFIAYVRESRYTHELLENHPEFTINVPLEDLDPKIMEISGSVTGRSLDKIKALKLTTVDSDKVQVPGIKELPLTLECKIIYKQRQDPPALQDEGWRRFYLNNTDGSAKDENGNYHVAYYGEIVNAYIIEAEKDR